MFRTVPLSIIRSFSLYTQQWYKSYRFADSLWAGSGQTCFGQFLCPSSGVFHCAHSNGICHTGLLTTCEQDQDRHVSDSSSVHHQEFFTVHTAAVYVLQVCWQLAARKLSADRYDIHVPLQCVQRKTPDDGQRNCPKHVEFYSKNNVEKLVNPVGFIVRIYHDAWSPELESTLSVLRIKLFPIVWITREEQVAC